MGFLDIHAHILPGVDDGAEDIETSCTLLEMLKAQGVSDVIATPHFYSTREDDANFFNRVNAAFDDLQSVVYGKGLPRVHLGCELYYFSGIRNSVSLRKFVLQNTKYLLLELPYDEPITNLVIADIEGIYDNFGMIPILAHIERYSYLHGYKKLLKLIEKGAALAHVNAHALLISQRGKISEKLIKDGYASFLASDTHSSDVRPPKLDEAFDHISRRLGEEYSETLKRNSTELLREIEACNAK